MATSSDTTEEMNTPILLNSIEVLVRKTPEKQPIHGTLIQLDLNKT